MTPRGQTAGSKISEGDLGSNSGAVSMTDTLGVTLRCSLLCFKFEMSVIDSDILVASWWCLLREGPGTFWK